MSDKAVPVWFGLVALCSSGHSAPPSLVKERRPQGHPGCRGWQHVGPSGPSSGVGAWSLWTVRRAVLEVNSTSKKYRCSTKRCCVYLGFKPSFPEK